MRTLLTGTFILLVTNIALSSTSSSLPYSVCPSITESASQVLSAIRSLEDEINKET